MAALDGAPAALADVVGSLDLPPEAVLLGPVPIVGESEGERERLLIRVPRSDGSVLASALAALQAGRSARKSPHALRIQLDPHQLG
jgi:primosomal protein N' (replication factor Y)